MTDRDRADRARFERTYEENWLPVFRFATAWTNDRDAAEDIAQETFIRLWGHRAMFDWDAHALPWLLVTARRLAVNRFRALRRLLAVTVREVAVREVAVRAGAPNDPDRWLDTRAALSRLAPRERAALLSVAVIGLSPAEAGRALGVSEGAVRALISRARKKLAEAA